MTTFVNEKRICGCTPEGFGEHQTRHYDYEVKCVECGRWTADYGDVSVSMNKDGSEQGWICKECVRQNEIECEVASDAAR